MKLTSLTTLNGKKLTQPQKNLLAKVEAMGVCPSDEPYEVLNPISGYSKVLDPVLGHLVHWVYSVTLNAERGFFGFNGTKVTIQTFDRVRYFILAMDSEVYYDFID